MKYKTERIGTTLVVKLRGEIDQHCTGELREDIEREIKLRHISTLIFDLGGVTFMDSSGLGLIMGRYKSMHALGGSIMIVRPRPQVEKVLELAGIKKLIDRERR